MKNRNLYGLLVDHPITQKRTDRDRLSEMRQINGLSKAFISTYENRITPGIQKPSLISSFKGQIKTLLFVFPDGILFDENDNPIKERILAYQSIIQALRKETKFIVVHNSKGLPMIKDWFKQSGHVETNIQFVPVQDYIALTDWAEDAYVCISDLEDGSTFLLEPWKFSRAGDALIADYVSQYAEGVNSSQSPLIFQGGNCLIGEDFWFLGIDYFLDSMDFLANNRAPVNLPADADPAKITLELFKDYVDGERKLILIGTNKEIPQKYYSGYKENGEYYLDLVGGAGSRQPIFHIDMFITLVGEIDGKFTVLVGSPREAERLLNAKFKHSFDYAFDEIALGLSNQGFNVVRNPLVVNTVNQGKRTLEYLKKISINDEELLVAVRDLVASGAKDKDQVNIVEYYHMTWNNCLVEKMKNEAHVYLPTYGHGSLSTFKIIDDFMEKLWIGFKFRPHMLGNFDSFARRSGVVHCLKKFIERGDN